MVLEHEAGGAQLRKVGEVEVWVGSAFLEFFEGLELAVEQGEDFVALRDSRVCEDTVLKALPVPAEVGYCHEGVREADVALEVVDEGYGAFLGEPAIEADGAFRRCGANELDALEAVLQRIGGDGLQTGHRTVEGFAVAVKFRHEIDFALAEPDFHGVALRFNDRSGAQAVRGSGAGLGWSGGLWSGSLGWNGGQRLSGGLWRRWEHHTLRWRARQNRTRHTPPGRTGESKTKHGNNHCRYARKSMFHYFPQVRGGL